MGEHIHIGLWFVVNVMLAMAIINPFMRILAGHFHDTPIGRAIAFLF